LIFNPGTEAILFGDLNLGQVAPGNSIQIPIVFSGIDAQTGTYQTQLSVFATDSEGQVALPTVSLTLQVTAGVTPITGDTFSTSPTCSLSATTMNLNNTYSFTCSGVVSNLQITIPSSNFYIGKNVEISSGIYRYDFIPVDYGETQFIAEFRYNGASIFQPFSQDIRISSAGSLVPGTSLKFVFTPKLDDATGDEEKFLIQLADNKTGSLVSGPIVLVNAVAVNKTGDYSFEFAFESNTDYEVRGKAPGYEDLVETINVKSQKIEIRINPGVGDSSTMFNITTSVDNATLTILDQNYIGNYYGVLPGGAVEIKAVKEGYKIEIINFTVDDRPRIIAFGSEFKKNVAQNFTLNKIGDWIIYHKNSLGATERTEYAKGSGDLIEFTPEKSGAYVIEVSGIHVGTYEIEGFSFTNKWGFLPAWAWLILGAILVLIIIVVIARKKFKEVMRLRKQMVLGYPLMWERIKMGVGDSIKIYSGKSKKIIHVPINPESVQDSTQIKALAYENAELKGENAQLKGHIAKIKDRDTDKNEEENVKAVLDQQTHEIRLKSQGQVFSLKKFYAKFFRDKKFREKLGIYSFDRSTRLANFGDIGISEDGDFTLFDDQGNIILRMSRLKDMMQSVGALEMIWLGE